ncbi:MAG: HAMP domain-containing histidine kinase [Nitrospinae bacterium]|nr:HAMP domain-containing histidine kinase [Nitrospinota bacterium]
MKPAESSQQQNRERRLIGLIWLGVIISLSLVAAIAYSVNRTVKEENERAFTKNLTFLADSSAKSVELFMESVISDMITSSQLDAVKRYDIQAVDKAFRGIISKHDERISHMILLDGAGETRLIVTKAPDPHLLHGQIHSFFLETMPRWRVNIATRIVQTPHYRGIAVGMPIFRQARPEGEKGAGGIFASGMIIALIGVDDLVKTIIEPVRVGSSGFAWLYNGETIMADAGKIDGMAGDIYGAMGDGGRLASEFRMAASGHRTAGWIPLNQDGRRLKVDGAREEWYVSMAAVRILDKSWSLAVAAPEWEATRLLNKSFWQTMSLLVVVVLIVVLGGTLMTRANRRLALAEEKALHAIELEEKNRVLEDLNRRMDEFVAVVSHDIRSPLNVISGFVKMIQSSREGGHFQRETATMLRSCNRLMQLVNDILDVSKLEGGKVILAYDPIVIDDIIEESVRTMEFAANEKKQEITINLGEKTTLDCDGAKLLQVMNNLISNAIKFTPRGGAITVSKTAENGHVTVKVSDTGPGIPADQQGIVFEKFEQLRTHQLGIEPGSGLGLTICKNLVELHGGTVGVSSVSGQGSTFHITLPLKKPGR